MRGRIGHVMWRRAAYWTPAVVAAALLVGGIAAVWTHGLPARAGVGSRQTTATTAPGSWAALATTPDPYASTLLLLPSGKVLMPPSSFYGNATTANIYDPATNTWSQTSTYSQSVGEQAVLLHDGTALFTGNFLSGGSGTEIYNPVHDSWQAASALNTTRVGEALITLQDGRVLAAAGYGSSATTYGVLSSTEIYDPATDKWTTAASMAHGRVDPTMVLLPDGRVFVVGGWSYPGVSTANPKAAFGAQVSGLNVVPGRPLCGTAGCPVAVPTAEVYDLASNTWASAGSLPETEGRTGFTATLLPSGKVLIAGGVIGTGLAVATTNALYDPTSNTWTQAATMANQRAYHTAALLATGQVIVAGGYGTNTGTTAEIYDPKANTWMPAPNMPTGHAGGGAVVLQDGRFFVSGDQAFGTGSFVPDMPIGQPSAPRGSPSTEVTAAFSTVPGLPTDVKATAGNNAATVTWSAATPDGSPISGYTVTASPGGKSATVPGTATSATVGGLSEGASYTFTVAATNSFGAGPRSAPSNAVTPTGPSSTPTPTSPPAAPTDTPSGGTGSGPTAQTSATPTPTSAPAATDTPTPQTSANNPPPGPPKANRSTGGSPPFLLLGLLVLVILLIGGGAVFVFARRGGSGT